MANKDTKASEEAQQTSKGEDGKTRKPPPPPDGTPLIIERRGFS